MFQAISSSPVLSAHARAAGNLLIELTARALNYLEKRRKIMQFRALDRGTLQDIGVDLHDLNQLSQTCDPADISMLLDILRARRTAESIRPLNLF
jgi:uncharacterized protein YjiS (DUF1127 family)